MTLIQIFYIPRRMYNRVYGDGYVSPCVWLLTLSQHVV